MKNLNLNNIFVLALLIFFFLCPLLNSLSFAEELSDWLEVHDVRSYNFVNSVGLVIRVKNNKQVDINCDYPDHLQLLPNEPGQEVSLKLFLSQWTKNKNVSFRIYYTPGECSQGNNQGNVRIKGFYFE